MSKAEFVMGWISEQLAKEESELERLKSVVHHNHHLEILRDVSAIAILNALDENKDFDYADAEETIKLCEEWVEGKPIEPA